MTNTKNKGLLYYVVLFMVTLQSTVFADTNSTATGLLRSTASEQIEGDIGWLVIISGVVIASIIMMVQKNIILPLIVFIGSIIFAMSPDLASGIVSQFG